MKRKRKSRWLWIFPVCTFITTFIFVVIFIYEKKQVDSKKIIFQSIENEISFLREEFQEIQDKIDAFE